MDVLQVPGSVRPALSHWQAAWSESCSRTLQRRRSDAPTSVDTVPGATHWASTPRSRAGCPRSHATSDAPGDSPEKRPILGVGQACARAAPRGGSVDPWVRPLQAGEPFTPLRARQGDTSCVSRTSGNAERARRPFPPGRASPRRESTPQWIHLASWILEAGDAQLLGIARASSREPHRRCCASVRASSSSCLTGRLARRRAHRRCRARGPTRAGSDLFKPLLETLGERPC